MFLGDLLSILYFSSQTQASPSSTYEYFFDALSILANGLRLSEIYNCLVIVTVSYRYKNYANLFGFISKILITLHLIVLFRLLRRSWCTCWCW